MSVPIRVADFEGYEASFGDVGLKVGARTGLKRRTKDDMEWYVVRRFLKEAIIAGMFELPLFVRKGSPPKEPDFVLEHENSAALIEITEATDEADQKEMTAIENSDQLAVLQGEYGGRFAGGASQPGIPWAEDVVEAIERKARKVIFELSHVSRHLVIYPNSNASALLSDEEDERDAAGYLQAAIARKHHALVQVTNGCRIHILGKAHVFLDVVGDFVLWKRRRYI